MSGPGEARRRDTQLNGCAYSVGRGMEISREDFDLRSARTHVHVVGYRHCPLSLSRLTTHDSVDSTEPGRSRSIPPAAQYTVDGKYISVHAQTAVKTDGFSQGRQTDGAEGVGVARRLPSRRTQRSRADDLTHLGLDRRLLEALGV